MTHMEMMMLDLRCIYQTTEVAPHGYRLSNGVIVVWTSRTTQRNFANLEAAQAAYATLIVIN